MMRLLLLISFFAFPIWANAQFLSPAQLDTAYVFRSLDEALKNPEEVYSLRLKVKRGKIPAEVFDLPYLHVLELKRGKITELPDDFTRLNNLIRLDLTNNRFNSIPQVLFQMPQLEVLRLGKNEISRVPEAIVEMKNLQVLDLWSTEVPRLPLVIAEMESLREVDMRMIEISQEDQDYLVELMPEVNFQFSVPCNCR